MRLFLKTFFILILFFLYFYPHHFAFAETTVFRSAQTVTTDGTPPFINLSNCSYTDGLTCDHPLANYYANLYFRDFGDFGIPDGSTITGVRLRVTGKANVGPYVGVSQGGTNGFNCQFPSDLWTMWTLNGSTMKTFTASSLVTNISLWCLTLTNIKTNNLTWKINYSSGWNWSANIDNFEIAFDYTPPPAPTIAPSPTPSPFLDLPWDYKSQGKSFEDVIYNPTSWFDHQYPLQDFNCCITDIMKYTGTRTQDYYKSHSGYDYALQNGVQLDTPVLAAAPGWATFKPGSKSGGAGNMIKIDHENGYETWYEHLSKDGLIVSSEGEKVFVNKGQQIGKVGMTGNTNGPHIHLSVFRDENNNKTFTDDYPFGLVDPLGWGGKDPDPWTEREISGRRGAKSYNLFLDRSNQKTTSLPSTGGSVVDGRFNLVAPNGFFNSQLNFVLKKGPFESTLESAKGILPSLLIEAYNSANQSVSEFLKPLSLIYDYSKADLLNINEDTISFYFLNNQDIWEKMPTQIDKANKKAQTETNHFTHFALMGNLRDIIPPITHSTITGEKGKDDWYRSNVQVTLQGEDNEGGVGLQYVLYSFNNNDWNEYKEPLIIEEEGEHEIFYKSIDKADNKEELKKINFKIDKTPPILTSETTVGNMPYAFGSWTNKDVITTFTCTDSLSGVDTVSSPIQVSTEGENQSIEGECLDKAGNSSKLTVSGINIDKTPPELLLVAPLFIWPPNGKMVSVEVGGKIEEPNLASKKFTIKDEYNKVEPSLNDFGIIMLESKRNGNDMDGRLYTISLEAIDLAGNQNQTKINIIVPHDNRLN